MSKVPIPNPEGVKNTKEGIEYMNRGEYNKALDCFNKAIMIDRNNVVAWSGKGLALQRLESNDEAIKSFDRVIELKPDDVNSWLNKGFSLYFLGRKGDAIKCFDKVIQLDPNNQNARDGKSNALVLPDDNDVFLQRQDNHDEAIKSFDRAIELKPDDVTVWLNKGFSLHFLGRKGDAIKCFDKAIQLDPNNQDARDAKSNAVS
jgi:tetratricopeptide (TPR) repeat protein